MSHNWSSLPLTIAIDRFRIFLVIKSLYLNSFVLAILLLPFLFIYVPYSPHLHEKRTNLNKWCCSSLYRFQAQTARELQFCFSRELQDITAQSLSSIGFSGKFNILPGEALLASTVDNIKDTGAYLTRT